MRYTIAMENFILPILVIFFAALIRSTFGFGDALIAMPLLALLINVKTATPVVAVMGFMLAAGILLKDWKSIRFTSTWRLIAGSLIGIPFGVWYIHFVPENTTKIILGIILILTGILNLFKPKSLPEVPLRSAYGFGFIAGILGSAYNTNGPPILLYGLMRKWEPESFRATMQSYFLPTNLLIILGHFGSGLWTPLVWQLFLAVLPAILLAYFLGSYLARKFSPEQFSYAVYWLVMGMGLIMILTSI